ncbi:hypothetical protein cypCar_00028807 [Cyprinus carpio]|nr:hypothetical protein cypCar_00028807 [Cyprinus carpio]
MSTDDSISEDVTSSVALSHDQISASGGKESEASIVSSEDTVSGLPEEERSASHPEGFLQTTEGEDRPSSTPACNISNKIRNLCLRTEEEFSSGRSLPFINPSSIETLRALVQEIQSSGETDPEIWKNCEVRRCPRPRCPFPHAVTAQVSGPSSRVSHRSGDSSSHALSCGEHPTSHS